MGHPHLDPMKKHTLHEPPGEKEEEEYAAENPKPATSTDDPNRMTIYVPSDHTTLNLGQPGPTWIPDRGLTAKTDHHVHFFVVGKDNEAEQTLVSLGGGATSVTIPRNDPDVGTATAGYAMITKGIAWHESEKTQIVLSREGLIGVRALGGDIGIQSDEKKVYVFGEKGVALGSKDAVKLASHPDLEPQKELRHGGDWLHEFAALTFAKESIALIEALELIEVAKVIWKAGKAWHKKYTDKSNFQTLTVQVVNRASLKMLSDVLVFGTTIGRLASDLRNKEAPGTVSVSAKSNVAVTAGSNVTVYANVSTGIVAGCHAELLAGNTAVVHGHMVAELHGGKEVEISSKEVSIEGEEEVKISSEDNIHISACGLDGHANLAGTEMASLTSAKGTAAVTGAEEALLSAGPEGEAGAGVHVTPHDVTIGMLTTVKRKGATPDAEAGIKVTASAINVTLKNSKVEITDKATEFNVRRFTVKSQDKVAIEAIGDSVHIA